MIIVSNSKGYTVEFEALQGVLDFFGAEEGTAIISGEHSEYGLTLFASDAVEDPFV